MKFICIFLIFISLGFKGYSQNWIYVDTDKSGDKLYVKSSYVTKGGEFGNEANIIKVWIKREAKKSTIFKNGKEITVYNVKELILREFDCKEHKNKLISRVTYNSKGDIISTFKVLDNIQEWVDITPESIGEAVLNKVCELYNN